jgi:hypothetical protein
LTEERKRSGASRAGTLTAQIRLKIRHQERGRHPLAGDIADDDPQPVAAQAQKVVIIAPDLARLDTESGVLERGGVREPLREQPGLHLSRDGQFVRGAAPS